MMMRSAATTEETRLVYRSGSAAFRLRTLEQHLRAESSSPEAHHHARGEVQPFNASSTIAPPSDFVYSPEVSVALKRGGPIVALESTIISHGMPWPENLATAKEVEQVVRDNGATPATIAILDGVIHVGLDEAALTKLAKLGTKAHKTSRRDLAYVQAKGLTGATTVSATSLIAARAGIHIFATGGIGGVHRYGETSKATTSLILALACCFLMMFLVHFCNNEAMDISADLTELGRTPITVVCAGAKSFLDIERTLEYLVSDLLPHLYGGDSVV